MVAGSASPAGPVPSFVYVRKNVPPSTAKLVQQLSSCEAPQFVRPGPPGAQCGWAAASTPDSKAGVASKVTEASGTLPSVPPSGAAVVASKPASVSGNGPASLPSTSATQNPVAVLHVAPGGQRDAATPYGQFVPCGGPTTVLTCALHFPLKRISSSRTRSFGTSVM